MHFIDSNERRVIFLNSKREVTVAKRLKATRRQVQDKYWISRELLLLSHTLCK